MRIVHIITRLILGGAQENTLITCRELARRGHKVFLITGPAAGPEGALFEQTMASGYEVMVVRSMRRAIWPGKDLVSFFKIKKLLKEICPDIVHTHSAKAGVLGRWAAWGLKGKCGLEDEKKPYVVHTIHGLAFHPYQSGLVNRFYIAVEQSLGRRTDAFITVADAMTEKSRAAGIGLDKPYTTAYSAIDEEQFLAEQTETQRLKFRQQYGIPTDAIVLVCVARLASLKGHKYIIESARRLADKHPNAVWLFVGDGELAGKIKDRIERAGLTERFFFTGLLSPERIPLALHSSDILVHCSLREGLARVLPQAMLCGKPVVSFDIDGAKEVVNERTGFLIEPKDIDGLTSACARLIEDGQLRCNLGQAGRESAKKKFSPQRMVDVIENVYRGLMEG